MNMNFKVYFVYNMIPLPISILCLITIYVVAQVLVPLCYRTKVFFLLLRSSYFFFNFLQTVDVFAIIALSGILSRLLSSGTVLVATSNRAPKDLNQVFFEFTLVTACVIMEYGPFEWFHLD